MGTIKNFLQYNKQFVYLYKIRNKNILRYEERSIVPGKVNLHYWRRRSGEDNIGDYLSCVVVDFMKEYYDLNDDTTRKTKHLYAIGSILQAGRQNATVWGSGFLDPLTHGLSKYMKYFRKLDIRIVRGPNTRKHLLELGYKCPEIYGDPAILMPLIYKGCCVDKTREYTVVKHYTDETPSEYSLNILTNDYKTFIDTILESKLVISSSLHGIILAEAYGVPAILYKPDNAQTTLFKFEDYYFSTNRFEFPVAKSIEEALTLTPCALPELSEIQNNLIKTFPKDLWGK